MKRFEIGESSKGGGGYSSSSSDEENLDSHFSNLPDSYKRQYDKKQEDALLHQQLLELAKSTRFAYHTQFIESTMSIEVLFSALYCPTLHSELLTQLSGIGLSIREEHEFATNDGYVLSRFIVDGLEIEVLNQEFLRIFASRIGQSVPLDVEIQFLTLMPVKFIVRNWHVRPDWTAIMQKPAFMRANHCHQKENLALIRSFKEFEDTESYETYTEDEGLNLEAHHPFPFPSYKNLTYKIIGISHGVVCIITPDSMIGGHSTIILWNPSIRRILSLRTTRDEYLSEFRFKIGLGYNKLKEDYVLVQITLLAGMPLDIEVYDLNEKAWRRVGYKVTAETFGFGPTDDFLQLNDSLHWLGSNGSSDMPNAILVFDMCEESLQVFNIVVKGAWQRSKLVIVKDCLSCITYDLQEGECYVYVMEVYGDSSSWVEKKRIALSDDVWGIPGIKGNSELLQVRGGDLYSIEIDPEIDTRELTENDPEWWTRIFEIKPSLLKDLGLSTGNGGRFGAPFYYGKYKASLVLLGLGQTYEEFVSEDPIQEEEKEIETEEVSADQKVLALKEDIPTTREAQEQTRAKTIEKHDNLCELSRALVIFASASSVSTECKEFLRLVDEEIELYNSMLDKEGVDEKEAIKAYKAAAEENKQDEDTAESSGVSSPLRVRVISMLQNLEILEKEIIDVDAKIVDCHRLLDSDSDGKVTPEKLFAATMKLKDHLRKEGVQELISSLAKDKEEKFLRGWLFEPTKM